MPQHRIQQLFPGHDQAAVAHERLQQVKLLAGERDALPVHGDLAAAGVQGDIGGGQHVGGLLLGGAAQHGLHPAEQLHDPEGLDHVVVRARCPGPPPCPSPLPRAVSRITGVSRVAGFWRKKRSRESPSSPGSIRSSSTSSGVFPLQGLAEGAALLKALGLVACLAQGVYNQLADGRVVLHGVNHASDSPLYSPVTAYCTHSAMLVAWSPMRSKYLAIISMSNAARAEAGALRELLDQLVLHAEEEARPPRRPGQ